MNRGRVGKVELAPGAKPPRTVAEIVAFGRATYLERLEGGESAEDALTAALAASIAAERVACILLVESWETLAKRHGTLDGTWAVRKIIEDLLGER